MIDDLETNEQLLARLRDPADQGAWIEFVELYQPVLQRVARKYGFQAADADNLTQDVLQKVIRKIPEWENGRPAGGIRKWLAVVARNAAIDTLRIVRPDMPKGGTTVQERLQNFEDDQRWLADEIHQQVERQVFQQAAMRIRKEFANETWIAFWATMVEGRSCSEVADELGKTVGAIYTARSRVMQRLKDEVSRTDWNALEVDHQNGEAE